MLQQQKSLLPHSSGDGTCQWQGSTTAVFWSSDEEVISWGKRKLQLVSQHLIFECSAQKVTLAPQYFLRWGPQSKPAPLVHPAWEYERVLFIIKAQSRAAGWSETSLHGAMRPRLCICMCFIPCFCQLLKIVNTIININLLWRLYADSIIFMKTKHNPPSP